MTAVSRTARALIGCAIMAGLLIISGPAVVSYPAAEDNVILSHTAHALVRADKIALIDIRRPDEWADTGLAQGAFAVTMHQPMAQFMAALADLGIGPDTEKPIALICARGVRSRWLQGELINAGYGNVIDVSDGMMGSPAGAGWLASELPVRPAP